ncbi:MAG: 2Fe-2S iron-sulfur cluster-binding protein [Pseudonocardia sp.]
MTATQVPRTTVKTVSATIDGRQVTVTDGTSIYDAAKQAGIDIPVLCHDERYDPVGVCRMCVVDTGGREFAAACVRPCEDGMEVRTATPELERNRATLTELLLADQPPRTEDPKQTTTGDNLLLALADGFGVARETTELPCGSGRGKDSSNPVIDVDHDACILCDRCVRAGDDIQGNDVIGRSGKGFSTRIAFDLDDPMGASSCVTCGECVQACPTGALTNKSIRDIPIQLPGFARSTVDGYAVRAADTYGASEGLPSYLDLAGAVRMGRAPEVTVPPGGCVAIPTGAVLPGGADAVVMVEFTAETMPGTIEVTRPVAPGGGLVQADEDVAADDMLVPAGRPLRAPDLGLLAAAGVTEVVVHARPRVAIVSTGDEVVPPSTRELAPVRCAMPRRQHWPGSSPMPVASPCSPGSCPTTPARWR